MLDRMATISVALALELVSLITVARQSRTLRSLGFDHAALRKGLIAILVEGDEAMRMLKNRMAAPKVQPQNDR